MSLIGTHFLGRLNHHYSLGVFVAVFLFEALTSRYFVVAEAPPSQFSVGQLKRVYLFSIGDL